MRAKKLNLDSVVAYNASRYLLAVVLLLSGVSKLFSLNSFASEVQQYSELYVGSVFVSWSGVIAFAVCCIEIVLGMALSFAKTSVAASIGVLALMTFFLCLTGEYQIRILKYSFGLLRCNILQWYVSDCSKRQKAGCELGKC